MEKYQKYKNKYLQLKGGFTKLNILVACHLENMEKKIFVRYFDNDIYKYIPINDIYRRNIVEDIGFTIENLNYIDTSTSNKNRTEIDYINWNDAPYNYYNFIFPMYCPIGIMFSNTFNINLRNDNSTIGILTTVALNLLVSIVDRLKFGGTVVFIDVYNNDNYYFNLFLERDFIMNGNKVLEPVSSNDKIILNKYSVGTENFFKDYDIRNKKMFAYKKIYDEILTIF